MNRRVVLIFLLIFPVVSLVSCVVTTVMQKLIKLFVKVLDSPFSSIRKLHLYPERSSKNVRSFVFFSFIKRFLAYDNK